MDLQNSGKIPRMFNLQPGYDSVWPILCPDAPPDCVVKRCNPVTTRWECACDSNEQHPPAAVCGSSGHWQWGCQGGLPFDWQFPPSS